MKERPILFSTPMVQAILEGRKTQTRRVVKPQPNTEMWEDEWRGENLEPVVRDKSGVYSLIDNLHLCPYGQVGDVLWVRESFGIGGKVFSKNYYYYKADEGISIPFHDFDIKWRPSIYMPKEACRIFLKITDIRVERLQSINVRDAIAEGIELIKNSPYGFKIYGGFMGGGNGGTGISFQSLWISINGEQSWDDNPWVWVIEFERIEKPNL